MAARKKALFPSIATSLLDATLKSIPPKQAATMKAADHAAIMKATNDVALVVAELVESAASEAGADEEQE